MDLHSQAQAQVAANMKIDDIFTVIQGRPFLKDPLSYFNTNHSVPQKTRVFLTITDSVPVWQTDLLLGERMLADVIVCPYSLAENTSFPLESHMTEFQRTKDVLKQRMRYPGVQESPILTQVAKTWVLSTKLHLGPDAMKFLDPSCTSIHTCLQPIFTSLNMEPILNVVKIEVGDGHERQILYKLLDSVFRPSLLLVKWSYDLDNHIPTAHCAGHIVNSGYSLIYTSEQYALYMFTEETLYDICSMKILGIKNPFIASILESIQVPVATELNTIVEEETIVE
jgi:hypothetical protein